MTTFKKNAKIATSINVKFLSLIDYIIDRQIFVTWSINDRL